MKKLLPALIVIVIAVGAWFLMTKKNGPGPSSSTTSSSSPAQGSGEQGAAGSSISQPLSVDQSRQASSGGSSSIAGGSLGGQGAEAGEQQRSATDLYNSAEDALAAVVKGSKDFDDSILEQFIEPGDNCSWCNAFYHSVRELATNPNTPQDQKSYLAEVLAISGRVENLETLAESIKNAQSTTDADIYAEALELATGKEDVTRFLANQMAATNDTLREAAVSAMTNQGSRLAAELLNQHVQDRGDADAYYSDGMGPGEFIPDDDARPYVMELVEQRNQFSPMWAKSLINSGLPGLRMIFDHLETSTNAESDKALLKDAIDHVNFEDGLKELTDAVIANNHNQQALGFARKIQEEFNEQGEEEPATTQP